MNDYNDFELAKLNQRQLVSDNRLKVIICFFFFIMKDRQF